MSKDKLNKAFANRKAKIRKCGITSKEINLQPFIDKYGQETLDNWKKQYENRPLIYLKVNEYLAVLVPTADDLGDYVTAIGTNGMSKAAAMIIEQLWLDGDYELIDSER